MSEPSESQIKRLAVLLAAAHWRGVLQHLYLDGGHAHVHEAMIAAAAEADHKRFETRACLALEGVKK